MNLQFEHKLDDRWNSNILNTDSGTIEVTNWTSNRVPGAGDDLLIPAAMAVIQAGQVQHTSLDDAAHTVTVANGASLVSQSYLDITGDFINAGTTTIDSNDQFRVAGTVSNDGIITISARGNAVLKLTSASQRLIGGGQLIMQTTDLQGYYPGIVSTVPGGILENASTIVGNGRIGGFPNEGSLILHNNAGGVVEANNAPGPIDSSYGTHILVITGGAGANNASEAVVNQGTLRASTGGALVLNGTDVQNLGGTIDANGGIVYLSFSTVFGGTIVGTGGVAVHDNSGSFTSGRVGLLDGSTGAGAVHNQGLVLGAGMSLKGIIDNSGTIRTSLNGNGSNLVLVGAVTFSGGGALDLLGDPAGNAGQVSIIGNSATTLSTLVNVDNTIRGSGNVGGNRLALDNRVGGVVDANNATKLLKLALSEGVANAGVLKASAAGGLSIDHTTVTNSGSGSIQAVGSGAHVDLFGGTVIGGTLATSGGSVIQTTAFDFSLLDGSTSAGAVTSNGAFTVNGQTRLTVKGALVNNGVFTDASGGFIGIDSAGAALSGGGTLLMQGGPVEGMSTTSVAALRNSSTIAGYGFLGSAFDYNGTDGRLRVVNLASGVINATSSATALQLRSPDGMANSGLMEATAGGFLRLEVIAVDQTGGGVIKAVGAGSHVDISGSTITGGTVGSTGGGVAQFQNTSGGSLLDGGTLAGAVGVIGTVNVTPNSNLTLKGVVQNSGTVNVQAGATGGGNSGSVLYVDRSGVTLSGGGTVVIGAIPTNSSALTTYTGGLHAVLTNVDNSIVGAGLLGQNNGIGADDFTLLNGGTVNANQAGYTLTLRTGQVAGAGATTVNTGLLEATGSGTLLIADTLVQNDGVLKADGGTLRIDNTVVTGTGSGAIAHGGVLDVLGTFNQNVAFQDATGRLRLTHAYTGTISGFVAGDSIDLAFVPFSAGSPPTDTYSVSASGSTLTVKPTSGAAVTLKLPGFADASLFKLASDGNGGTLLTLSRNPAVTAQDYNADGRSDLVLQNDDGTIVIETQSGLAISGLSVLGNPGNSWHVVGTADFNGDGSPDVLIQNSDGQLIDYTMAGTAIASGAYLGQVGYGWHVRGTGDFDSDGKADVVMQKEDGSIVVFTTDGTRLTSGTFVGNPGAAYTVEAVADLNKDGHPDLVVASNAGVIIDYLMTGTTITAGNVLASVGAGWSVAGAADYNGDGPADLLLHNDNGSLVVFDTNGTAVTGSAYFGNPGASYAGTAVGVDLNGDGAIDLVARGNDGTLIGYTANTGQQLTGGAVLTSPGPSWHNIGLNPMEFLDGTTLAAGSSTAATAGQDQFDFNTAQAGAHFIAGFNAAQDSIVLSQAVFGSFAGVQANAVAYQGGTFIGFGSAALVIQGVAPSQLGTGNFILR